MGQFDFDLEYYIEQAKSYADKWIEDFAINNPYNVSNALRDGIYAAYLTGVEKALNIRIIH